MRIVKLIFALIMIFSLASCDNKNDICKIEGNSLIINEGVTELKRNSFGVSISDVENVYLPKSLKKLANGAFFELGMEFKNVYYASDLASWCDIEFGREYSNPMEHGWLMPKSFYYMDGDNYVKAEDLIIPDGVKVIPDHAFAGFSVKNVVIPKSVESIGERSFYGCFIYEGLQFEDESNIKELKRSAFDYVSYFGGELIIPNTISYIGKNALAFKKFNGRLSLPYLGNLSIDIPFVDFIGAYNASTIRITKGEEIGLFCGSSFSGNIEFCDEVVRIKANAFRETFANSIYFSPASKLKIIDDEAFAMVNSRYLFVPEGLDTIAKNSFKGAQMLLILSHAKKKEDIKIANVDSGLGYMKSVTHNDKKTGWVIEDNKIFILGSAQN